MRKYVGFYILLVFLFSLTLKNINDLKTRENDEKENYQNFNFYKHKLSKFL